MLILLLITKSRNESSPFRALTPENKRECFFISICTEMKQPVQNIEPFLNGEWQRAGLEADIRVSLSWNLPNESAPRYLGLPMMIHQSMRHRWGSPALIKTDP